MAVKKDVLGMTFGRLTVVCQRGSKNKYVCWDCKCICGKIVNVRGSDLRKGSIKSCGCLNSESTSDRNRSTKSKHGHTAGFTHTRTYNSWRSMISRCYNESYEGYKNYGGRGIGICDRWYVFENFLLDMGDRPEGMTLDRIDVDGNYQPQNCKWSTFKEQSSNKRKRP